jgi:glycosyltransferase involved in cell wall biosynthesis
MRIGIDARYLSHGLLGGVRTYVASLVPALVELGDNHQIYLYADTKVPFELPELVDRVTLRVLPWRSGLSSVQHDLFMRRQMAQDELDVVHFPANYGFAPAGARKIVTLHDAMNLESIGSILRGLIRGSGQLAPRSAAMMAYLHYCTCLSLRGADLVLTDSEHARREILRYSGLPADKVVSVLPAPAPDTQAVDDPLRLADTRRRHGLDRPFVLADALKNPAALVEAWRLLPESLRSARQIVFFARRPELHPIVHEAVEAGQARLLLRPPHADLAALYSMAEAFVFPSWLEGFGMPVLEAMICGAPVIASDRGSIPEVAGDAALLADAEDPAALARHLSVVLGDPAQAARLRALGHARAAQFSWNMTARRILDIYQQVVSSGRRPALAPTYAR